MDLLEEILQVESPRLHSHNAFCNCKQCKSSQNGKHSTFCEYKKCSASKLMDIGNSKTLIDEILLDEVLNSSQLNAAVAYNNKYAKSVGWEPYQNNIRQLLGLTWVHNDLAFAEALSKWQSKNGFSGKNVDGKLGSGTWKKLKTLLGIKISSPFRGPLHDISTSVTAGSSYRIANPKRSFGIPETIKAIEWIAKEWNTRHPNIMVRIADISQKGGGRVPPHKSHRMGLDADISLVVRNSNERIGNSSRKGSSTKLVKNYSHYRQYAKKFVDLIVANPYLKVKVIWFFDHSLHPLILNSGTSRSHYRHFHVRFCMPSRYKSSLLHKKVYGSSEKKGNYNC